MFEAERLRALHEAATPGPWAYRPDRYDDWGMVKSPPLPTEGFEQGLRCCLAQFRHPEALDEKTLTEHRIAKTDPWQGNAELVTYLRNSVPTILAIAEDCKRMREALERIALSGDGEDVFERSTLYGTFQAIARAALNPGGAVGGEAPTP